MSFSPRKQAVHTQREYINLIKEQSKILHVFLIPDVLSEQDQIHCAGAGISGEIMSLQKSLIVSCFI